MREIFSLATLCRCCHADGSFQKTLDQYADVLLRAFSLVMKPPPCDASYSICDECATRLHDAFMFKQQVLDCERKFEDYCNNEQALSVKEEFIYSDGDDDKSSLKGCSDSENQEFNNVEACDEEIKVEIVPDEVKEEKYIDIEIDTKHDVKEAPKKKAPKAKVVKKRKVVKRIQPELEILVKTENGTVYSCKECNESFDALPKLRRHIMAEHTGSYKCRYCSRVINSHERYLAHIKKHTKERDEICNQCGKSFLSKRDLNEHMNTHTREKVFTCSICQKNFLYKATLKKHILWHNGQNKKFICDICGSSFNDRTNMNIHIRCVHEKLRPFVCTMCPKTFTAKKHLIVHFRNHTGEKPYQCDECSESFMDLQTLKRHKLKHDRHNSGIGYYVCKMCGEGFETRGRLVSHLRKHIGHKDHKCDICGKDFTSKYSLKRHIDSHNGIKPFKCDICNMEFCQKAQLVRHTYRNHDPTRAEKEGRVGQRIRCDLCFRHVYNLEKHKLIHLKRPHSCEWCGKCYPERNTLNRHIKHVHIGQKPHACTMCDKKYCKIESLKRHTLKVHKSTLKKEVDEP